MKRLITRKQLIKNVLFGISAPLILSIPIKSIRTAYLRLFVRSLGNGCFIGKSIDVRNPSGISIGNNVVINKRVLLDGRGGLSIGNNVDIAQDAHIWTEQHDYQDNHHKLKDAPVIIEDYVWICANSSILPGVTIKKGAVIALGAIVTKNVESLSVVAGVPAKEINKRINSLCYTLSYKPRFFDIQ